jgi:hypothetical protein
MAVIAVLIAVVRGRWRDPGFALPAAFLASGIAAQVVASQGERTDVLLLWLVPLYALAAWAVVQTTELARRALSGRAPARTVPAAIAASVVVVVALGGIDLSRSIRAVPGEQTLSNRWDAARTNAGVRYDAGIHPEASANTFYLPCDPPYDWGSETWYLKEVLDPGSGLTSAIEGGAFRWRSGPPCASHG